jgi:branched-chain amino acid transport system permease protein
MNQIALNALNGVALGMLLFLVAGGLTIIFGLLRVVNLSHGSLYLLGVYVGILVEERTDSFWLALLIAPIAVGLLAVVIDRVLRRRLYGQQLNQVLVTLGIAFVIGDVVLWQRGGNPALLRPPDQLRGGVELVDALVFPKYRLALIAAGLLFAAVLAYVWRRTKLGALLRAGVDDPTMLEAHGVRVSRLFTATFAAGAAMAGAAGVMGGPFLGIYTGIDLDVLLLSVVVVVVGGLGSLQGAFLGSLGVGLLDSFGRSYAPELSYFLIFGPVLLILALWPQGIFGTREA